MPEINPPDDGICIIWGCDSKATHQGHMLCLRDYKQLYRLGWLIPYKQRRIHHCVKCNAQTDHMWLGKCKRCYQASYTARPERRIAKRKADREYRARQRVQRKAQKQQEQQKIAALRGQ